LTGTKAGFSSTRNASTKSNRKTQGARGDFAGRGTPCAAQEELAVITEKLAAAEAALAQHKENLQAKREALRRWKTICANGRNQLRQAQSAAFAAAQDFPRIRNEITALDLQKQGNTSGSKNFPPEKSSLEEERTGWNRACTNSPRASSWKTERGHHARLGGAAAEPFARIADGIAKAPPSSRTNFCISRRKSVRA
jgi:hypothetical protein